jgi:LCP family protein required for cell wall assembly
MNSSGFPHSAGSYDDTQPYTPPAEPNAQTQPSQFSNPSPAYPPPPPLGSYDQTQPTQPPVDPQAATQVMPVSEQLSNFQPVSVQRPPAHAAPPPGLLRRRRRLGCFWVLPLAILGALAVYFLAPLRTNILVLGIDARPQEGVVGRTDTIILGTIVPLQPYVAALSIPRDLWVPIPGHSYNRINTAHFFAEADKPGSGPAAAAQVVETQFKVPVNYYIRVNFTGFEDVINALDGVTVDVPAGVAGFQPGVQHLNGMSALALVRSREGSDDFFRMSYGQLLLKAVARQMLSPAAWVRLPAVYEAVMKVTTTNIPAWQLPRLGLALLRAGSNGINFRSITREEVQPFTTSGGAQVLAPNWDKINPIVKQMFGN